MVRLWVETAPPTWVSRRKKPSLPTGRKAYGFIGNGTIKGSRLQTGQTDKIDTAIPAVCSCSWRAIPAELPAPLSHRVMAGAPVWKQPGPWHGILRVAVERTA